MRRFKVYLPVLLWMTVIFLVSTDLGSSRNTSRFIGPLLRWFKPDVTDETIRRVQAVIRKGGHVTEYAILALLFWRAGRVFRKDKPLMQNWRWREAGWIVLWCALYAISDELHQSFISTRQGNPWDVLLDSAGALVGLAGLWAIGRWKERW